MASAPTATSKVCVRVCGCGVPSSFPHSLQLTNSSWIFGGDHTSLVEDGFVVAGTVWMNLHTVSVFAYTSARTQVNSMAALFEDAVTCDVPEWIDAPRDGALVRTVHTVNEIMYPVACFYCFTLTTPTGLTAE